MLMIIFMHCINEYPVFTQQISKGFLVPIWGQFGSSIFLFMSGYGLFASMTSKENVDFSYLFRHIKKIILPFLVAFVLSIPMVSIAHLCGEDYSVQVSNILFLNMSIGTDMWFLKTILLLYVLMFCIIKYVKTNSRRILSLGCIMLTYIIMLYLNNVPGYWYASNLAFVFGVYHSMTAKDRHIHHWHILIICVLFVTLSVLYNLGIFNAPLMVLENIAGTFCILLLSLRLDINKKIYSIFAYIGKNSLLYYMLNIPVMIALCSSKMDWTVYFIANLTITTLLVILYNKMVSSKSNKASEIL